MIHPAAIGNRSRDHLLLPVMVIARRYFVLMLSAEGVIHLVTPLNPKKPSFLLYSVSQLVNLLVSSTSNDPLINSMFHFDVNQPQFEPVN